MRTIIFSIVIPAYNYAHVLERAVASAINLDGEDFEILVVNDGSDDDTEQVLLNLKKKYPGKFRFVSNNNSGLSATRNYGIDNTEGKYLIFLDADDELLPNALQYFRNELATHKKEPGIITGAHIAVFPYGREKLLNAGINNNASEKLFQDYLIKKKIRLCNGSLIMHRKIFKHCRYPEHLRNSEDIPVFAYALANFSCIEIKYPINKIYKSAGSLRHNYQYAIEISDRLIDEVFNPERIPLPFQKYKKSYSASRCLSLARTFYKHKDYVRSVNYLNKTLRYQWKLLFRMKMLKLILGCYFKKILV